MSRTNDNKQPMTKSLFLEKLSIHGADFARWDGYDASEAQEFLDKNDSVKDAYEQAQSLDIVLASYKVPADIDVDALIKKTSEQIEKDKVVGFADAKDRAEKRKRGMVYYWGGGMAVAASLMLMILTQPPQTQVVTPAEQPQPVELAMATTEANDSAATDDVAVQLAQEEQRLFATWEQALTEDLKQREIISLWETADARSTAMPEPEANRSAVTNAVAGGDAASTEPDAVQVDRFIENNYDVIEDEVLEREMDLWELYLKSEG